MRAGGGAHPGSDLPPRLRIIDDCPWKRVFDYWPERLSGMADAATVAVAVSNGYEAIATFDQKMIKRMQAAGVKSYW